MDKNKYIKNFREWSLIKEKIENRTYIPMVFVGDIWHIYAGINLGTEIDGKGDNFIRPVYVFKKISNDSFIGIPLTSKKGNSIDKVDISDTESYLAFSQIRSYSIKRCVKLLKSLPPEDQEKVGLIFHNLFCQ